MTIALLVLTCSGCTIPTIKNPLVNPSESKPFPKLHGVYRTTDCPDNIVLYAHVGPAGDGHPAGFLRIIFVSQPKTAETSLHAASYVGFVEQVGRYHLLHIPLSDTLKLDSKITIWDQKWDVDRVGGYMVVRLLVGADGVEMSSLNEGFIAEQITAKSLAGRVEQEMVERDGVTQIGQRTIAITADTDDLQEFFKRHMDGNLFNKPHWKFTRRE